MSKSKSQQYEQNNVYTQMPPVDSPDIQAFRDFQLNNDLLAPQLNYQYATAERDLNNSIDSAYSGITNPFLRAQMKQQGQAQLEQQRGVALEQGQYDLNRLQLAQREALAKLTKPQTVETKSYGYGPAPGNSTAGSAIGAGAAVATTAIIVA